MIMPSRHHSDPGQKRPKMLISVKCPKRSVQPTGQSQMLSFLAVTGATRRCITKPGESSITIVVPNLNQCVVRLWRSTGSPASPTRPLHETSFPSTSRLDQKYVVPIPRVLPGEVDVTPVRGQVESVRGREDPWVSVPGVQSGADGVPG